ncbi:FtsK/SpoIIIE domain-containing protein [Anaerotruncus rubiinfantis]|uniref:FtsK/SpoIIIE domain-containing protein n=1 Tax=Anaerotruncus rubiinfantis TaxID=1720200 RepID=UPI0034A29ED5
MNQNDKFQIERETVNHHWALRLQMGCKAILEDKRKRVVVLAYVLAALLLLLVRPWLFIWRENDVFSVIQRAGMGQLFPVAAVAGLFGLVVLFGTPIGWKSVQNSLRRVGLVNHAGEAPYLVASWRDKENPRVTVMEFETCGVPRSEWEDKREKLEAALNVYVAKIVEGSDKRRVLLYTASVGCALPAVLYWQKRYLSYRDFELVMGESVLGPVTVNLAQIPHILLGGSTGSGKSVLLKLLLMQSVKKNAAVCVADFKGGVDFPGAWQRKCRMIFDKADLLDFLTGLVEELERRKETFRAASCANIGEYNRRGAVAYERIIFACDEVAELLDKNGLCKEDKEQVSRIESKLSVIARQGRAFGIHLILTTQRPDATILTGQIRNNIDCRVCGRADSVLSQIILDSSDAADRIPKDAQGRFLMHDGTIFQGYLFDESRL